MHPGQALNPKNHLD